MAKKNSSGKKQAPAEWQGAVDASDEVSKKTGVHHDGGIPMVTEALDAETLKVQAHEMARLVGERTKVRDEKLESMRKFNDKLRGFEERISELAGEVESGVRKVPAQRDLPGTDASA